MREIHVSVTQRGQVTIPAEIRRRLGIKPKDKVAFQIDADEVRLAKPRFTIETVFGSVTPRRRPEDFEEVSRLAKEEKTERTLKELGGR